MFAQARPLIIIYIILSFIFKFRRLNFGIFLDIVQLIYFNIWPKKHAATQKDYPLIQRCLGLFQKNRCYY